MLYIETDIFHQGNKMFYKMHVISWYSVKILKNHQQNVIFCVTHATLLDCLDPDFGIFWLTCTSTEQRVPN